MRGEELERVKNGVFNPKDKELFNKDKKKAYEVLQEYGLKTIHSPYIRKERLFPQMSDVEATCFILHKCGFSQIIIASIINSSQPSVSLYIQRAYNKIAP